MYVINDTSGELRVLFDAWTALQKRCSTLGQTEIDTVRSITQNTMDLSDQQVGEFGLAAHDAEDRFFRELDEVRHQWMDLARRTTDYVRRSRV